MEVEESLDERMQNVVFQTFRMIEQKIISNPYYVMGRSNKNIENKLYCQLLFYLEKLYCIKEDEIESILWINNNFSKNYFQLSNNSRYVIPMNQYSLNYVQFEDILKNIEIFPNLKKIGKRFTSQEGISGYLLSLGLNSLEFNIETKNINSFSLIYFPNYFLFQKDINNSFEIQIIIRSPFQNFIEFDPEIDDF